MFITTINEYKKYLNESLDLQSIEIKKLITDTANDFINLGLTFLSDETKLKQLHEIIQADVEEKVEKNIESNGECTPHWFDLDINKNEAYTNTGADKEDENGNLLPSIVLLFEGNDDVYDSVQIDGISDFSFPEGATSDEEMAIYKAVKEIVENNEELNAKINGLLEFTNNVFAGSIEEQRERMSDDDGYMSDREFHAWANPGLGR